MFKVMVLDDSYQALSGLCSTVKTSANGRDFNVVRLDFHRTRKADQQENYDDIWTSLSEAKSALNAMEGDLCVVCVPFKLPLDSVPKSLCEYENWIDGAINLNDSWRMLVKPLVQAFEFNLLVVDADLLGSGEHYQAWSSGLFLAEKMKKEGLKFPWDNSKYIIWTGQEDAIKGIRENDPSYKKIVKSAEKKDEGKDAKNASILFVEIAAQLRLTENLTLECARLFNTTYGENIGHGMTKQFIPAKELPQVIKFVRKYTTLCGNLFSELGLFTAHKQCELVEGQFMKNLLKIRAEIDANESGKIDRETLCRRFWSEVLKTSCDWIDPLNGSPARVKNYLSSKTANSDQLEDGVETFEDWREFFFKMRFWPSDGNSWLDALSGLLAQAVERSDITVVFEKPLKNLKLEIFLPKIWMAELFDYLSSPKRFLRKLHDDNTPHTVWLSAQRINGEVQDNRVKNAPYQIVLKISSTRSFSANGDQMPGTLNYLVKPSHLRHVYDLYVATKDGKNGANQLKQVAVKGDGHEIQAVKAVNGLSAEDVLINPAAKSGFALVFNSFDGS